MTGHWRSPRHITMSTDAAVLIFLRRLCNDDTPSALAVGTASC